MAKIVKVNEASNVSGDVIAVPAAVVGDTLVGLAATQTMTNKTLTAPVLGGSVTGTYTLAGTPTITSPTITAPSISGGGTTSAQIDGDMKKCSTTFTATSGDTGSTLTNVTGLTGWTLVAGATYAFEVNLSTVCTTNSGISVAFKYTTATLTSIEVSSTTFAAASVGNARSTTAADQTKYVDNKTAAWLAVQMKGTMVVNAGGTVAIQAAQNTSHADATSVFVGSYATFRRIA